MTGSPVQALDLSTALPVRELRALAGEQVTITRHDKPVAEPRPTVNAGAGRPSAKLIDEIAARANTLPSLGESAVDIIRRMRDDYP